MKKLFVAAILSSSMMFAAPAPTTVAQAAVKTVAPAQKKAACYVKSLIQSTFKQGKQHYLLSGTALTVAGIVALYYTNAEFRKAVHAWLGLSEEVTVVKQK